MTIPAKVGEMLAQGDLSTIPGTLNFEDNCAGAKFHSPNPLIVQYVPLLDPVWSGAGSLGPLVWLCSTCLDNLRVYQHLLAEHEGQLEWPIRREFGNLIRALGDDAWHQYMQERELGATSA